MNYGVNWNKFLSIFLLITLEISFTLVNITTTLAKMKWKCVISKSDSTLFRKCIRSYAIFLFWITFKIWWWTIIFSFKYNYLIYIIICDHTWCHCQYCYYFSGPKKCDKTWNYRAIAYPNYGIVIIWVWSNWYKTTNAVEYYCRLSFDWDIQYFEKNIGSCSS